VALELWGTRRGRDQIKAGAVIARAGAASVPIPKFASLGGTLSCELRNQRDTSKSMILVPLLDPKFAMRTRGTGARTSGSGH
jgi:hypothetical protein